LKRSVIDVPKIAQTAACAEREAIADDAVRRVASKRGDPWHLHEELPLPGPAIGHGSPQNWSRRPD
jgi:hypothetical protein